MKPIIREYLASLRERGELDAILPDLLSEMGFNVYSRPSRGTRQYGVDVAAVGPAGDRRLYLFSIKRGDLTRSEWDGDSVQSLRASLNDIRDVYLPSHVPDAYKDLPVVICLCFGGDVHEQIRLTVSTYTNSNTTYRISFEEWNGDRLAGLIEDGLLREGLLSGPMRSSFRKAVAMSDEPETSFAHFSVLVESLRDAVKDAAEKDRIRAARQISICTWILFVWARDSGNVESPYLASEAALLNVWHMLRDIYDTNGTSADACGAIISQLAELHFQVWEEFLGKKVLPRAEERYAISAAVRSWATIDVNLRLFDLLGRIAMRGLWMLWEEPGSGQLPSVRQERYRDGRADVLAQRLCALIGSNPVLLSPISDDQVVDLSLAFTFLAWQGGADQALNDWISELVQRAIFAFRTHKAYPCTLRDYRDLAEHPRERTEEHRREATASSVLWPTLAFWAAGLENGPVLKLISEFKQEYLPHCNFQFWIPDEDSEESMYIDAAEHGTAFTDIPVTDNPREILDYVYQECGKGTPFFQLSAVKLDHWPLLAMACRHYHLPIPPHLWSCLLPITDAVATGSLSPGC